MPFGIFWGALMSAMCECDRVVRGLTRSSGESLFLGDGGVVYNENWKKRNPVV